MANRTKLKQLITLNLTLLLPKLPALISQGYSLAASLGIQDKSIAYAPPLEKERVAYEQGRAVQDVLFKWAAGNPFFKAIWEENTNRLVHAAIYAGELHMTAHRVPYPGAFPRPACYRQQNALSNLSWLPGMEPDYDPAKGIYLNLLHGPAKEDKYAVGFIQIAVPAPEKKTWLFILDVEINNASPAPIENIPEKALTAVKRMRKNSNDA